MSNDRKMLFFDIDGTLITDDAYKIFPESAKKAISSARSNGHLTFINTGRVMANIEDSIKEAGFDGYVCGCGTNIFAEDKEILHNILSKEKCRRIAEKCRECNMMSIFEHKNHTAYDKEVEGNLHLEILSYFKSMGIKLIDDIYSEDFVFDKFACWYEDGNEKLGEFIEYMSRDFSCIDRGNNFYEIVPKGYSKATGIEFLKNYYNVPLDNIYVFGDSNNDLDMLAYAPNSIAMGECTEEVYKVASYKTNTVLDDGIYNAMKHFGVI